MVGSRRRGCRANSKTTSIRRVRDAGYRERGQTNLDEIGQSRAILINYMQPRGRRIAGRPLCAALSNQCVMVSVRGSAKLTSQSQKRAVFVVSGHDQIRDKAQEHRSRVPSVRPPFSCSHMCLGSLQASAKDCT